MTILQSIKSKGATFLLNLMVVSLFVALVGCSEEPKQAIIEAGKVFPKARLNNFDGSQQTIDDYRGKVTVINFWASWCAPCRREMPALERLAAQLDPDHFSVIGVSVDEDKYLAQEFLHQHDISFTNYHDGKQVLAQQFLGVRAYPETFIVNAAGEIERMILGEQRWDSPAMISILDQIKQNKSNAGEIWVYGKQ